MASHQPLRHSLQCLQFKSAFTQPPRPQNSKQVDPIRQIVTVLSWAKLNCPFRIKGGTSHYISHAVARRDLLIAPSLKSRYFKEINQSRRVPPVIMNMNRAAAAAHAEDMHGDHVLQGGHAILKEDTDPTGQESTFSDASRGGMKQSSGLEGTKQGDLQATAGASGAFKETMRQEALRDQFDQ